MLANSLNKIITTGKPYITKTCLCNVYPLVPHFYIAELGYAGVYLIFLFLLQNIDCGYSLEPPWRGGYSAIYVLSKNKKNIKLFQQNFQFFLTKKISCLLHGQVFEMIAKTTFLVFFFCFFFFFILRPYLDYFSSYETSQSVGRRKREKTDKNT